MSTPFKMTGFSGFGNSPMKQSMSTKQLKEHKKKLIAENNNRANYNASDTTGAANIAIDLNQGKLTEVPSEASLDIYKTTRERVVNDENQNWTHSLNKNVEKDLKASRVNKKKKKK